jgi:transposase-like protein
MAKRRFSPSRRPHWTESDARRVLAEWERSGHSLEAFARSRGLVPQRLAWWRKRLRTSRSETSAALTLVPATVVDATAVSSTGRVAMIRLPHGIVIEIDGVSPAWVAALARELARSAS